MCGIAGIISSEPSQVSEERLHLMNQAQAHRGPDGAAIWKNDSGTVGFAHRRLAIIDLSEAARQPMHFGNRYTVSFNGEIYNYRELRNELEQKAYRFQTASDTEVLLACYQEYGSDAVKKFDGMFAFAIWDEKEKILFAARDRLGEKPFFYHFDEEHLAFASEMKALWAIGIERQPNLKMHFNYLTIGYVDNPSRPEETFFKNIFRLPPGYFMVYREGNDELLTEKYWDIDINAVDHRIKEGEAVEKFTGLLKNSVQKRLRSDLPIGTCLSGGLDSSAIVHLAREISSPAFLPTCITAVFPGFEKDESKFAALLAEKESLKQITVHPTAESLLQSMDELAYHQEEPFGSASVFLQYEVYRAAKQQGIPVLLDGQGADEILAGYHKYYKWYWQELFRNRKLITSGEIRSARSLGIAESFGAKNIIAALFPDFAAVFLERRYLVHALQQADLNRDFVKSQSREAYYSLPSLFTLNGILYFNTIMHGLEELLRYADRNSMAFGREVRLPFLNHELVEFVFSLPPSFKIRKGWTKWLLRQSMKDKLPSEIVWRKDKTGFEPPQLKWMQHPALQDAIQKSRKKLVEHGILRPEILKKPIKPHAAHASSPLDWRYLSAAKVL